MLQNPCLLWLATLTVCLIPQSTLSHKKPARGVHISPPGLTGLQGAHPPTYAVKPLAQQTASYQPCQTGQSCAVQGQSGWPLVTVKFDHPIQSPVDVVTSRAVTMNLPVLNIVEPVQPNVKAKVYNSGHTVYVYIKDDPSFRPHLSGGPLKERFVFEQMHFHWGTEDIWGSEHFVDGESFAVEIHMVHYNSKYGTFGNAATQPDGLAVLTVFAEGKAEDNPLLDPLFKLLPVIAEANSSREISSVEAMKWAVSGLGINHEYYTYPGSLTTPPYSENVVFIILPKPITLSKKQLGAFRTLHSDHHGYILENKRQLQPLHDRPIIRCSTTR